jgi:hypothetical protein
LALYPPESVFIMPSFKFMDRHLAVFGLVAAFCLVGWFSAVPRVMSPSTFAFAAVCLMGATAVAVVTWRNAQATDSTAQLLHATEVATADTANADRH